MTCARDDAQRVWCWGATAWGPSQETSLVIGPAATHLEALDPAVAIAVGGTLACAATHTARGNSLACWGWAPSAVETPTPIDTPEVIPLTAQLGTATTLWLHATRHGVCVRAPADDGSGGTIADCHRPTIEGEFVTQAASDSEGTARLRGDTESLGNTLVGPVTACGLYDDGQARCRLTFPSFDTAEIGRHGDLVFGDTSDVATGGEHTCLLSRHGARTFVDCFSSQAGSTRFGQLGRLEGSEVPLPVIGPWS